MDNDAENRDGEDVILTAKQTRPSISGTCCWGAIVEINEWLDRTCFEQLLDVFAPIDWNTVRCLEPEGSSQSIGHYILGCGLFGFSEGITNWIAVKML